MRLETTQVLQDNPETVAVVIRGGENQCYGTAILPVSSLGTEYYAICAGYSISGETSQVRSLDALKVGKM